MKKLLLITLILSLLTYLVKSNTCDMADQNLCSECNTSSQCTACYSWGEGYIGPLLASWTLAELGGNCKTKRTDSDYTDKHALVLNNQQNSGDTVGIVLCQSDYPFLVIDSTNIQTCTNTYQSVAETDTQAEKGKFCRQMGYYKDASDVYTAFCSMCKKGFVPTGSVQASHNVVLGTTFAANLQYPKTCTTAGAINECLYSYYDINSSSTVPWCYGCKLSFVVSNDN